MPMATFAKKAGGDTTKSSTASETKKKTSKKEKVEEPVTPKKAAKKAKKEEQGTPVQHRLYTLKFNSPILPFAKFPLTQNKYI